MKVYHFCPICKKCAGPQSFDTIQESLDCESCGADIDTKDNRDSGNVFLYLSLREQLKEFFELCDDEQYDFLKTRKKTCEYAIEDIFDGSSYDHLDKSMISVNFCIDGASIFHHSNFSIYPLLCTINELPPRQRGNNIMLVALWFGKGKPKHMNEFVKPFIEESQILYTNGFHYYRNGKLITRKCRVLIGMSD